MKAVGAPHGPVRYLAARAGAAAAVAVIYFLAARLGLALISAPSDMAVFWPASGIGAGLLIATGPRTRPALMIGVIVGNVAANLMSDRSVLTSLFVGILSAGEAMLAAWPLERWFGRPFMFGDLRRVAGFFVAAGTATAASAVAGAATMSLLHADTTAPYWDVWRTWFLSGWVGVVMVAPLVIGLTQAWRKPPSREGWIQGLGVLGLLAIACAYTMTQQTGSWLSFSPSAFVLPLLLWLTARCPPAFGIAGAFMASVAFIGATTFGIGRFGDAAVPIIERVRGAQLAIMMVTLFTLVLAALFAQRKEAEKSLAKERTMLVRLHEVGSRLWLKRDLRQALDQILAGAIELLGADMGAIRILDSARGMLTIEAQQGFEQKYLDCFGELPVDGGSPCCRAVRSVDRMVIENIETDPLFTPFRSLAYSAGYRALQSTPILNREGMPLGTLATHFRQVHKPAEEDLRLLDLYVRQAADIIERHKAEDALLKSEDRLRLAAKQLRDLSDELTTTLNSAGIGIMRCSRDLRFLRANETYATIAGLSLGEIIGRPIVEVIGEAAFATIRPYIERVLAGERLEYESVIPYDKGAENPYFRVVYVPDRDPSGSVIGWIACIADITASKRAEMRLAERNTQLALAGQAALVGSYAYESDLETMKVSEGYCAMHGLPEGTTETTRSEWRARVYREDLGRVEEGRARSFRDQRKEYNVDYRIVRAGGDVRWIESRSFVSYDDGGRPRSIIGVNIDITERKRAEDGLRLLNAELDHRVKNTLATISAVVSHTQQGSRSVAKFAAALDGRIRSMATTHELLSSGRWQGISLAELIRHELAPYAARDNARINGPEVLLRPEAGRAMAMVLHELATNAAKYGALSTKNGHVSIWWDQRPNGHSRSHLVLEWREIGGPAIEAPGKPSYGTSTIRDLIPYEFGGAVDFVLAPEGVQCRLELPADWLSNHVEHIAGEGTRTSLPLVMTSKRTARELGAGQDPR